jgi:hypothetical protein
MLDNDIRLAAFADHDAILTSACSFRELPSTNPAVYPRPSVSLEAFSRRRTYLSSLFIRDTHFSHDTLGGPGSIIVSLAGIGRLSS